MDDRRTSFWRFVHARQALFARRADGRPPPWTDDPVLAGHRFCNVYRAADRVSQYLLGRVLYGPGVPASPVDRVFRAVLFRLFNKPETWELLRGSLGEPTLATFDVPAATALLDAAMWKREPIWSSAFIIRPPMDTTSGRERAGTAPKHTLWFRELARWRAEGVFDRLAEARTRQAVYATLRARNYVAEFMAMQWTTDLGYADLPALARSTEDDFIVAGLGAARGASKLRPEQTSGQVIVDLAGEQEASFEALGLDFPWLDVGGTRRRLSLMDVQNCLCEWDKYTRVARPELGNGLMPTKIKRTFDPLAAQGRPLPPPVYPPSWRGQRALEPRATLEQEALR